MSLDLAQTIPAHCTSWCTGNHESVHRAGDGLFHSGDPQLIDVAGDADGITLTVEAWEDGGGVVGRPYLAIRMRDVCVEIPGVGEALELAEAIIRAGRSLVEVQHVRDVITAYEEGRSRPGQKVTAST